MKLYSLDRRLESEEVDFVAAVLKLSEPIEQIRIPYVLPAPAPNGGYRGRHIIESGLIEHHLLNAGILLDRGRKVCLVTSEESHWHQSLISAIFKLTGRYPCLIQTENRRKDLNNLVHIRVVDMEELIGKDNTKI